MITVKAEEVTAFAVVAVMKFDPCVNGGESGPIKMRKIRLNLVKINWP